MKLKLGIVAAGLLAAAPVFADSHGATGDAAAGEKAFRQCVACHVVVNEAGDTLAGKKAKTGPNLYGIAGRAAGAQEGFKYSKSMVAAGEAGLVWTEESFVAFVKDPGGYMKEASGDSKARSNMSFKVRKEGDAENLYAYLASLSAE
ncbi:c-type cytochrome [Actibacterium lipolyticum]|uniref:Cytochrome c2 n=1 Tax=Actibacterium lipolyticum TaxID=1524263 RepID=A0A238KV29_9RHOB|nr:c-type cytochrome [Actibacterium lipolyticum]SMX46704.1 Cytochrome c2 [Actibacterium lipolyticum]